ncbi:MAG: adenylosuccinate lyase [Clostridia bacterium]
MNDRYISPFSTRYASDEMQALFSEDHKFRTWRRLWIILAKVQKELGLNITDEQIRELEAKADDINHEDARRIEKENRHDVMSHIMAYGLQCPLAKGIIHLGATSCFVGDNTDILIMRDALGIVQKKIQEVIRNLADFAMEHRGLPTLGYTHFQPAQLVTVGKRATLWLQDLMLDLEELDFICKTIRPRGAKGTTGTQASFLSLFDNDHEKVKRLDQMVAEEMGFKESFPVTGQTYPRKMDARILNGLSQVAISAHKFANDIRLLQNLKEIEEPFEKNQVGSSAMAYKRNPMRCERMTALARYVIANALNPAMTASEQWLERTLDDSANRRISISEGFLAVDAILNIYMNVSRGLVVYPMVIRRHILEELPFMATENILMEAVKRGGDRQVLHERIRLHSMEASRKVKEEGKPNDLMERIANDTHFGFGGGELDEILDPERFTGRSKMQVEEFIRDRVIPAIAGTSGENIGGELKV